MPLGRRIDEFLIAETEAALEKRLVGLFPKPVKRTAGRPSYDARPVVETPAINKRMQFPGCAQIVATLPTGEKQRRVVRDRPVSGVPWGARKGSDDLRARSARFSTEGHSG